MYRYKIFRLSARALMSYAKEENNQYTFHLNQSDTNRCKIYTAQHEEEDNALFFQIMCVLHGNHFSLPKNKTLIEDLSDILFVMDFSEIFDRDSKIKRFAERQKKAEYMFRPEGITLDFGSGQHRYVAFERSASMSRNARLSFIRADFYEPVHKRILLDLDIGLCQLSKLYAYNGLMLSGGTRIENIEIDAPHRVIVVDNRKLNRCAKVITVKDCGGTDSVRKYERVEEEQDFTITEFDGEGIISKEYANRIDKVFCNKHIHTSFQIRLPYVKGMVHEVDFKDFFKSANVREIKDLWGASHRIEDVDIILTKSMFKAYGWFAENQKTWNDYWKAFRKYRHALYITNVSKEKPEHFTQLNYQFLNTVSMKAEEFRPFDLPDGWTVSPETEERNWITKQTETEYYKLCADKEYRQDYFLSALHFRGIDRKSKRFLLGKILKKNPNFIHESIYTDELNAQAEKIYKNYSLGILQVAGDNRYLSGDLLEFLNCFLDTPKKLNKRQSTFFSIASATSFHKNSFYAPKSVYAKNKVCTLLRNPHIARNEEIQLYPYQDVEQIRKHYLGHLTDVIMVDSEMFAAERLGGADYDGDMIKTISDPILNQCVSRNYDMPDTIDVIDSIPFLKIPTAEPVLRDAKDWQARFKTVKDTFSSRVGQISNAALNRSIIAYNENTNSKERERYRKETETLAILTGLEIDSAKSGVKPDLSAYLGTEQSRSLFLKYKYLTEKKDGHTEWYEPSFKEKLDSFMHNTDWSKISSNVERLPYLAYMLKKNTPKISPKKQTDQDLFSFAQEENWKENLDKNLLSGLQNIIKEYESCLTRIRISKAPIKVKQKQSDIDRILYSRGQDEQYNSDELYAVFSQIDAEQISALRNAIRKETWHFMDVKERQHFLVENIPADIITNYGALLCDFRLGGYRIFGDLISDIDNENIHAYRKNLERDGDSDLMRAMVDAYLHKSSNESYREAVAKACRLKLNKYINPSLAVRYAIALGQRNFVWDVLLDKVAENASVSEV